MAAIVMSLDTKTRAVSVTVDGQALEADSLYFWSSKDCEGNPRVEFSYSKVVKDPSGLATRMAYYLPEPDETQNQSGAELRQTKAEDITIGGMTIAKATDKAVATQLAAFLRAK